MYEEKSSHMPDLLMTEGAKMQRASFKNRSSFAIPYLPECYRYSEIIRRSRFIATFAHVASAEQAKIFVNRIRQEFPDATHNCWAYVAGSPGDTRVIGYSDDGEPHGTAGRPMLTALLHSQIGEIAVVVTRYFGGIKLGTGGLVHAYQGIVLSGLHNLPLRTYIKSAELEIILDYPYISLFHRILHEYEARILRETFTTQLTASISIPQDKVEAFTQHFTEITGGSVLISLRAE